MKWIPPVHFHWLARFIYLFSHSLLSHWLIDWLIDLLIFFLGWKTGDERLSTERENGGEVVSGRVEPASSSLPLPSDTAAVVVELNGINQVPQRVTMKKESALMMRRSSLAKDIGDGKRPRVKKTVSFSSMPNERKITSGKR